MLQAFLTIVSQYTPKCWCSKRETKVLKYILDVLLSDLFSEDSFSSLMALSVTSKMALHTCGDEGGTVTPWVQTISAILPSYIQVLVASISIQLLRVHLGKQQQVTQVAPRIKSPRRSYSMLTPAWPNAGVMAIWGVNQMIGNFSSFCLSYLCNSDFQMKK